MQLTFFVVARVRKYKLYSATFKSTILLIIVTLYTRFLEFISHLTGHLYPLNYIFLSSSPTSP